jgi:Gamma-glutamyl cyclotransferase, AIG2-like
MVPAILYRVVMGTTEPEPWQVQRIKLYPAVLRGYQRRKHKYADYPGIIPLSRVQAWESEGEGNTSGGEGGGGEAAGTGSSSALADQPTTKEILPCVRGVLARGLLDQDMRRLDTFEGDEYDCMKVRVELLQHGPESKEGAEEGASGVSADPVFVDAETYVFKNVADLEQEEWDFEDFKANKVAPWVGGSNEYNGKCSKVIEQGWGRWILLTGRSRRGRAL